MWHNYCMRDSVDAQSYKTKNWHEKRTAILGPAGCMLRPQPAGRKAKQTNKKKTQLKSCSTTEILCRLMFLLSFYIQRSSNEVVFVSCTSLIHTGSNTQARSFTVDVPQSIGFGSHSVTISILDEFEQSSLATLQFEIIGNHLLWMEQWQYIKRNFQLSGK